MVKHVVALNAFMAAEGAFNFVTIGDWGGAATISLLDKHIAAAK